MQAGDLVDLKSLEEQEDNLGINFVDMYMYSMAAKYPVMESSFKNIKDVDKFTFLKKITP